MLNKFFKTITLLIIIGSISAVSGFCVDMWFGSVVDIAQAASLECVNTDAANSFQNSLPEQHSNNIMPCCVSGSGQISASIIGQQFNFINIFAMVPGSTENFFPFVNQKELLNLPILAPPEKQSLSTINIRI